jgi:hypothetical protein
VAGATCPQEDHSNLLFPGAHGNENTGKSCLAQPEFFSYGNIFFRSIVLDLRDAEVLDIFHGDIIYQTTFI